MKWTKTKSNCLNFGILKWRKINHKKHEVPKKRTSLAREVREALEAVPCHRNLRGKPGEYHGSCKHLSRPSSAYFSSPNFIVA